MQMETGGKLVEALETRYILNKALSYKGCMNQFLVAIEEMSELQKELCKIFRSRTDIGAIEEEIADVQIMLWQLEMVFGEERITEHIKKKLLRIETRVEEGTL